MRLVFLPGLDGTGLLFKPLLVHLPDNINIDVIDYPVDRKLDYHLLVDYVDQRLPDDDYIIVAESFSGFIAYAIAHRKPPALKSIVFVASFLKSPTRLLQWVRWLPVSWFASLPLPEYIIRNYLFGLEADRVDILLFKETLKKVSSSVIAYRLREIAKMEAQKQPITLPCSYIQAADDRLVARDNIKLFQSLVEDLAIYRVQGPHFILQAKPAECAKIIVKQYNCGAA